MKRMWKTKYLPWAVGGLGLAGCVLRWSLYSLFTDSRGLLPRMHPAELVLWLVTALTAALAWAGTRRLSGSERYGDNFSVSLAAALGHILLGSGILLTVLLNAPVMAGRMEQLWKVLGILSAPALFYAGFARVMGKKPNFLCYVMVSIFFALHLVCHYRIWCSDPQLQNYGFVFAGTLGLMVFAYYQAAACVEMGKRRQLLAVGLVTAYFCLVSLPHAQYLYLLLGGALWSLTGLCRIEGVPSRDENAGDGYAAP